MRAFPLSLETPYPLLLPSSIVTTPLSPSRPLNPNLPTAIPPSLKSQSSIHRLSSCCFCSDSSQLDAEISDYSGDDDDYEVDDDCFAEEATELLNDEGVYIEIKKLGRNSRRIRSKIGLDATLESVWSILTDYEKLSDFIPGLAVSQLVEKNGNCARLYQIGQQNLPFGFKFNAKGVLDCYEKDLEILPSGQRREIEFKMIEGDFQLFEGKWSIEQFESGNREGVAESHCRNFQTTLSYLVDVQPKMWLPVRLVEGRLCKEIKTNLSCIREEARKAIQSVLHDL